MKPLLWVCCAFLACAICGCDPGWAEAMEKVDDGTPGLCDRFCEDRLDCEWDADGEAEGSARDAALDHCVFECAWYMAKGCYAIEETTYYDDEGFDEETTYEVTQHVSGEKLESALECMWDLETQGCEDEYGIYYFVELSQVDEGGCDEYQECRNLLDWSDGAEFEWQDFLGSGGCYSLLDDYDEDVYVVEQLDCAHFFQGAFWY